jgi:hypothetical protein
VTNFLPFGFWFDAWRRVSKACPKCGMPMYTPSGSSASHYWLHSSSDHAMSCRVSRNPSGVVPGVDPYDQAQSA